MLEVYSILLGIVVILVWAFGMLLLLKLSYQTRERKGSMMPTPMEDRKRELIQLVEEAKVRFIQEIDPWMKELTDIAMCESPPSVTMPDGTVCNYIGPLPMWKGPWSEQKGTTMSEPFIDEKVLSDDYPIYGDYFYLADGKVYRSNWHDVTVAELKQREGFQEVRSCNWRRFNGTNAQIMALSAGDTTRKSKE